MRGGGLNIEDHWGVPGDKLRELRFQGKVPTPTPPPPPCAASPQTPHLPTARGPHSHSLSSLSRSLLVQGTGGLVLLQLDCCTNCASRRQMELAGLCVGPNMAIGHIVKFGMALSRAMRLRLCN